MTKELRELKFAINVFDDLKYSRHCSISEIWMHQDSLDACHQAILIINKDKDKLPTRLSPSDEQLHGYALLPTDEKTPNIETVKNCKLITQKL